MKLADNKATLSFSNGAPSVELPVYQGTVGPDVVDIRKAVRPESGHVYLRPPVSFDRCLPISHHLH